MALPFDPPLEPMLARAAESIPEGGGLLYEPKWDGFRALIFRDGEEIEIQSRAGQPLQRYFPELLAPLRAALPKRAVVDGELVVAGRSALDFDALLQRIHPAASRVARLSEETPASFVAFDLLALSARDLRKVPFVERRALLERNLRPSKQVLLTPQTDDAAVARRWFAAFEGAGLDGVIAKPATSPYLPGERALIKVKHARTADCVVGGYRVSKSGDGIGSLLLGLYDEEGVLHFVGHTSSFAAPERRRLLREFRPLHGESFGEGRTPGAPSRWARGKELAWTSVRPERVCEVRYDQLQGGRFRHATTFLRWRPDKRPEECTFDQLVPPRPFHLGDLAQRASLPA